MEDLLTKFKTKLVIKENPTVSEVLITCIEEEYKKEMEADIWRDSKFKLINLLKNNNSGNVGEIFLTKICQYFNLDYIYDKKKGLVDTYDIIILNKKIEVKTARMGLSKSFQHENLRKNGCDYYLFIDISPNYFYITIIPPFDFDCKHPIFNRKAHLRKGTSNVYKFDYNEKILADSISHNSTFKIDDKCNIDLIKDFLLTKLC